MAWRNTRSLPRDEIISGHQRPSAVSTKSFRLSSEISNFNCMIQSGRNARALTAQASQRDGIESTGMERRALHESNGSENNSPDDSMSANGVSGIVRAGGREAAAA